MKKYQLFLSICAAAVSMCVSPTEIKREWRSDGPDIRIESNGFCERNNAKDCIISYKDIVVSLFVQDLLEEREKEKLEKEISLTLDLESPHSISLFRSILAGVKKIFVGRKKVVFFVQVDEKNFLNVVLSYYKKVSAEEQVKLLHDIFLLIDFFKIPELMTTFIHLLPQLCYRNDALLLSKELFIPSVCHKELKSFLPKVCTEPIANVVPVTFPGSVLRVAISPDGSLRMASLFDGALVKNTDKTERRFNVMAFVDSFAITPDNKNLLTCSQENCFARWDLATGKKELTVLAFNDISCSSFSPDAQFFAIYDRIFKVINVFEVKTKKKVASVSVPSGIVKRIALTSAAHYVMAVFEYGAVAVYDLSNPLSIKKKTINILLKGGDCASYKHYFVCFDRDTFIIVNARTGLIVDRIKFQYAHDPHFAISEDFESMIFFPWGKSSGFLLRFCCLDFALDFEQRLLLQILQLRKKHSLPFSKIINKKCAQSWSNSAFGRFSSLRQKEIEKTMARKKFFGLF